MKNIVRFLLSLLVVCSLIGLHSACSEENDCSMTGRPMMYCTFKVLDPDDRSIVRNDTLDSLTIRALGTDSIILNNEKNVSRLILPLRYANDTTTFILQYDPLRKPNDIDTLYVIHKSTPFFQSMECGYLMKQSITNVKFGNRNNSSEKIESVDLQNQEANSNEIENAQIFYKYRDRTPPTAN